MKASLLIALMLLNTVLLAQGSAEELSVADLDKMNRGKIITKKRRAESKIIVVAQGIVIGDSRKTFDVLMECDKHTEFMPNFKACEEYFHERDSIYGKTVIDPPMTKKDVSFYLFTKYRYSKKYAKIAWKLNTEENHPGYIADMYGFWEIKELGPNKQLLSFYSDSDFNFHWSVNWLLEPIFKFFIKNSLPDLIMNVRARVESGEKWVMGEKRPSPKVLDK